MAPNMIGTKILRKQAYKQLVILPLHIKHPGVSLAVENLQIGQQFSPTYSKEDVYGRMDPIVTYQNTGRSLRISFSCQAHHYFDGTSGVVDNVYQMNLLTQMLYPAYKGVAKGHKKSILRSPPFFRISYGSYIGSFSEQGLTPEGLTGYITGFSHELGAVARNVAFGAAAGKEHLALPREIKVNFSFEVIHDKEVGWRRSGDKDKFSENGYGENFPYRIGKKGASAPITTEKKPKTPPSQKPEASAEGGNPAGNPSVAADTRNDEGEEKKTAGKGTASPESQVKRGATAAVLGSKDEYPVQLYSPDRSSLKHWNKTTYR